VLLGDDAAHWLTRHPLEQGDYWRGFLTNDPSALVTNLSARTGIVVSGDEAFPLTVTEEPAGNAYPCSLLAQYVSYPLAELGLVKSPWQRWGARAGLNALQLALLAGEVDCTVQCNSWLLSTNLTPAALPRSIGEVTGRLLRRFPNHAILVKNIHDRENSGLPRLFQDAGYDLITSRQIYFFDGRDPRFLQKDTVKRDRKFLKEQTDYRVVEHEEFTGADVARVTDLYRQLYLDKHSRLNPQYTKRFVAGAIQKRWLELRGLRNKSGILDGVFGCFRLGETTSTPFIGYDTSLPRERGLYRLLVSLLLQRVAEERRLLNYSSGAGDFKRRRGGEPVIEFNAVYTRHLAPQRRAVFHLLRELANRVGRRFLEANEI
jgi:hypothetical protein